MDELANSSGCAPSCTRFYLGVNGKPRPQLELGELVERLF